MSKIMASTERSALATSGAIKNPVKEKRMEKIFSCINKNLVNKMGIDVKSKLTCRQNMENIINSMDFKKGLVKKAESIYESPVRENTRSLLDMIGKDDFKKPKAFNESELSPIQDKSRDKKKIAFKFPGSESLGFLND